MRRSHLALLGLVLLTGVFLYQTKYKVKGLEEHLAEVNQQIISEREAIHVLHAEISYMTRPDYINRLAEKHLNLASVSPPQVRQLADYIQTAEVIPLLREERLAAAQRYHVAMQQREDAAFVDEEIGDALDNPNDAEITPASIIDRGVQ